MKITIIAGARPNFMKIAPIIKVIEKKKLAGISINYRLIHTGQHYDKKLSDTFFKQLEIPNPDVNLGVGSGTQSEQTAGVMIAFEKELLQNPSDLVLVVGDVNSTMACTIVAKKLKIKVAHVEAGIRSNDMDMPEEINRMVTDSITDYFYTTSSAAGGNLLNQGVKKNKIFLVGNTMIDTLIANISKFIKPNFWDEYRLLEKNYFVLTMHRPSNVDAEKKLVELLMFIDNCCEDDSIIFPIHPRTKKMLSNSKCNFKNIKIVDPLGYLEFNYLVKNSRCVITDSGGITEETTYLKVPCITLRENTERPETVTEGTNVLVGTDFNIIKKYIDDVKSNKWKNSEVPKFWDGKTSERIVDNIIKNFI